MNPPLVSYQKPFLTIAKQISLLKSRGMLFNNEQKAKEYLENINYYRLCASGYLLKRIIKHIFLKKIQILKGY